MKIIFAIHHAGAFRSFDNVVRDLCAAGHQVIVLHGERDKPIAMDRALTACLREVANCGEGEFKARRLALRRANCRELANCANFLRAGHPNPSHFRRWINKVDQPQRFVAKTRMGVRLLASAVVRRSLARVEAGTPPDPGVVQWLQQQAPDVVFASPFIMPLSSEFEYVKAGKALGIPTVVGVLSWDNLTTKGTFHVMPDRVLVWNQAQIREAIELHDIPAEKLLATGAPVFDFWFALKPSRNKRDFCHTVGIDPAKPYIVYLGSSPFIARDETPFVQAFAEALQRSPATRDVTVVVRPHPTNSKFWRGFKAPNVAVWPPEGAFVDGPEAKQTYFDTLYHSSAIAGVNTSAMLEAAIMDRPCFTIMTAHYRQTQENLGHFKHLLDGDFLEIGHGFQEAVAIVEAVLQGRDAKAEQRRRFVGAFIRPHGIDRPASGIMAEAITAAARR